jgi:hypothetical protein
MSSQSRKLFLFFRSCVSFLFAFFEAHSNGIILFLPSFSENYFKGVILSEMFDVMCAKHLL